MIDTGAEISLIRYKILRKFIGINTKEIYRLEGIMDRSINTVGTVIGDLIIDGQMITHTFHVVPEGVMPDTYDVIIGVDLLENNLINIDFKRKRLSVPNNNQQENLRYKGNTEKRQLYVEFEKEIRNLNPSAIEPLEEMGSDDKELRSCGLMKQIRNCFKNKENKKYEKLCEENSKMSNESTKNEYKENEEKKIIENEEKYLTMGIRRKGILNLGLNCSISAVLQTILRLEQFQAILENEPKGMIQGHDRICRALKEIFKSLSGEERVINPASFICALAENGKNIIDTNRQNDAHEIYKFIEKILIESLDLTATKGIIVRYLYCKICGRMRKDEEILQDLSIPIVGNTVQECIEEYLNEEKLNLYECPNCRFKQVFMKYKIKIGPEILCIQLKRFSNDENKLNQEIYNYEKIQLGFEEYELKSIICHSGTLLSGHYVTLEKVGKDFYLYDDNDVTLVDLNFKEIRSDTIYLLFYEKIIKTEERDIKFYNENNQLRIPTKSKRILSINVERKFLGVDLKNSKIEKMKKMIDIGIVGGDDLKEKEKINETGISNYKNPHMEIIKLEQIDLSKKGKKIGKIKIKGNNIKTKKCRRDKNFNLGSLNENKKEFIKKENLPSKKSETEQSKKVELNKLIENRNEVNEFSGKLQNNIRDHGDQIEERETNMRLKKIGNKNFNSSSNDILQIMLKFNALSKKLNFEIREALTVLGNLSDNNQIVNSELFGKTLKFKYKDVDNYMQLDA